ncbi:MAG: polysaccharide pyruvyl transferase CsaB [Synergistaceae bacterium]|nr:polysaccharide pyruvyl transferase CsaB [Synergistaceae bacterium]
MKKYKAAILGYYGFGNLGDELLLEACLEMFRRCGVKREEVVVLSNAPEEISGPAVNRWKLREVVKVLRESETLLLGGGGLFQDATSVKSCVWYWGMVRLAKFLGCNVWAIGQSVGPLKTRAGKILAGNALRVCEVVHVRDSSSYTLAENLGCKNVVLGSDLVMTLAATAPAHPPAAAACTLVNLRPCTELETFTGVIAAHLTGRVIGVALSDEDIPVLERLGLTEIKRVRTLTDASELWAGAFRTIGMRLHFGVLSRIFRRPLAMIPYDPKVSAFAEQSGVPCIIDEWHEPVMPLPVPKNGAVEIDALCREILAL